MLNRIQKVFCNADPWGSGSLKFTWTFNQSVIFNKLVICFYGGRPCSESTQLRDLFAALVSARKVKKQCFGAGAGGAAILWDLEPELKLYFYKIFSAVEIMDKGGAGAKLK